MSRPTAARRAAFHVLVATYERDAFIRDVLKSSPQVSSLPVRDKAFAQRLALGVVATRGTLDDQLDRYLDKPSKVSPKVRTALRIAAFEILYMSTPDAAAVNQGVELVRMVAKPAAGMANAVLRRVVDRREQFLAGDGDKMVAAKHAAGLPSWLGSFLFCDLGAQDFFDLCESQLEPAPIYIQTNSYHDDQLGDAAQMGAVMQPIPGCYKLANTANLQQSECLAQFDCVVSDIASQAIAAAATRPGSCLEIGAGRGTKTFHMLSHAHRMGIDHTHVAVDLFESKCQLNVERLEQAGMPCVQTVSGDARNLDVILNCSNVCDASTLFDTVFLDVPCSGTGTMRRHPEIPWRLTSDELTHEIVPLQLKLLEAAAAHVACDGELIYATCSVLSCENEQVVEAFLETDLGKQFELVPVQDAFAFTQTGYASARTWVRDRSVHEGMFATHPALNQGDGHFCARLHRIK